MNKHQRNLKSATSLHYNHFSKSNTVGDSNKTDYSKKNYMKTILRKDNPTKDLLDVIGDLRHKSSKLTQKLHHQKNRADKWFGRYREDLKNKVYEYDKIILDNDQLRTTNNELNLMHHQAVTKILKLGQEIKK